MNVKMPQISPYMLVKLSGCVYMNEEAKSSLQWLDELQCACACRSESFWGQHMWARGRGMCENMLVVPPLSLLQKTASP